MKRLTLDPSTRADWLRRCPVFAELPPSVVGPLAALCLARQYARDETLFTSGQEAMGFFVVVDGLVKVSRAGAEAREQVLHLLGEGQLLGEAPVFEGGAYPADAVAVKPSRTLFVPRHDFLELSTRRPEVLLSMCAVLSRRLRRFVDLVDDLSLKDVAARLARYLLGEAAGSDVVELQITKALLARRLGTIAETLSRTLARLQSQSILDVAGPTITILDREALEQLGR